MAVFPDKPVRRTLLRGAALVAGAVLLAFAVSGCSLILGLDPLAVSDWNPRSSRLSAADVGPVWVQFSADLDRTKAEEAFSLSENATPMTGSFSWCGNRLTFVPFRPLQGGNDYEIAVLSSAETKDGNSLKKDFRFAFTTKTESGRPTITSLQPADGSFVPAPLQPVVVQFSEPVDPASFLAAWSVSPDPGGSISFDATGAVATFTPLSEWQPGTEYRVTVSDALRDLCGNHLADTRSSRFTAGTDGIKPHLLGAYAVLNDIPSSTPIAPGSAAAPTAGFEATMGLQIVFDKPVQRQNIESFIDIEPAWGYQIDPAGAPRTSFTLVPAERFAWGTRYQLTIRHGVRDTSGNSTAADALCFFRVDGTLTKPPSITQVTFNGDTAPLVPFGNLDLSAFAPGADAPAFFDVFVDLASGASIDPFSFMHAFTISATNGAALLTPISVAVEPTANPQPVRVTVRISNTTSSGMVTIGLSD